MARLPRSGSSPCASYSALFLVFSCSALRRFARLIRPLLTSVRSRRVLLHGALCWLRLHCLLRSHRAPAPRAPGPLSTSGPRWYLRLDHHRYLAQISPNKNMSFRCTTAAFTLSAVTLGFVVLCQLARRPSLLCDFCSSARTFALGLPSDNPSRTCPCPRLVLILLTSGPPTGDFHPMNSCPCRAYTTACT